MNFARDLSDADEFQKTDPYTGESKTVKRFKLDGDKARQARQDVQSLLRFLKYLATLLLVFVPLSMIQHFELSLTKGLSSWSKKVCSANENSLEDVHCTIANASAGIWGFFHDSAHNLLGWSMMTPEVLTTCILLAVLGVSWLQTDILNSFIKARSEAWVS